MSTDRLNHGGGAVREHTKTRVIAAMGLSVALFLGACRTDREITRPAPVPVTDKLIASGVLTAEDLPDGWVEAAKATPINADVIAGHPCDDKLKELEPKESASADFTLGGLRLSNSIAYFPGGGPAIERLLRDIVEDCKQVTVADQALKIRADALPFGVLSNDTFPVRFEFEPDVGPILESDLILIRDGDVVSIVRLDGPRPSDKTLLDTAVRASIGRLGAIATQI